jgi:hypothetical protein
MRKRFPSEREEKAVKRGADELMALAEWHFRRRPRVLLRLRKEFVRFCVRTYSALERSYQRQNGKKS